MVTLSREKSQDGEFLKLNTSGITMKLKVYTYLDGESIVLIVPSLKLTAYGDDEKEANSMLEVVLEDFCESLYDLSNKMRHAELLSLGWHKNQFKNKDYSKIFIDKYGALKGFNLSDEEIAAISESVLSFTAA